jgi:antitoxin ParD1/3/4
MRTTQQFSVTLPNEMAAQVRAKVASGEYASESEVIRDGLRALQERERAVETWLKNEVVSTYDAMRADPTRGQSVSEVRAALMAAARER